MRDLKSNTKRLVLLLRHAQTLWNQESRLQGQQDTDLTPDGIFKTHAYRQQLLLHPILFCPQHSKIVSSDLKRAAHTAQILFSDTHLIDTDQRLREGSYGLFEGLKKEEIKTRYPKMYEQWINQTPGFSIPNAEPKSLIYERVSFCVQDFITQHTQPIVIFITHGGVIKLLLNKLNINVERPIENLSMHALFLDSAKINIETPVADLAQALSFIQPFA